MAERTDQPPPQSVEFRAKDGGLGRTAAGRTTVSGHPLIPGHDATSLGPRLEKSADEEIRPGIRVTPAVEDRGCPLLTALPLRIRRNPAQFAGALAFHERAQA